MDSFLARERAALGEDADAFGGAPPVSEEGAPTGADSLMNDDTEPASSSGGRFDVSAFSRDAEPQQQSNVNITGTDEMSAFEQQYPDVQPSPAQPAFTVGSWFPNPSRTLWFHSLTLHSFCARACASVERLRSFALWTASSAYALATYATAARGGRDRAHQVSSPSAQGQTQDNNSLQSSPNSPPLMLQGMERTPGGQHPRTRRCCSSQQGGNHRQGGASHRRLLC